ncbi:chitobiase/beta-hexosaminidase C-terminal domain-containing protein [Spartinivicinus poritis]|uniref:Chitobiase/beta-hexosaminidase C-terminal domain-containing protein n=1 Tax=Spartinivicinus poritis TaxID=2994640 RepID=A0ABT5U6Q0_9GAMM|nr:family 16 glycoside hydrolase [Spartinivicinus sp. A2-2]MDE1462039.1 chitobiase/beta-hexosaminidase C-terminal domain-containing protein [Spartinivicinus sp. A2-2]
MLIHKYTKQWFFIASLLLLVMPPKVVAAPDLTGLVAIIEPLPEGSWVKVNLNQFSDVWTPAELRPLYDGAIPITPQTIIGAWSSFAWDSNRGDLIIYGGGHANYPGNDVYRWRGTTRQWERASLPSEITRSVLSHWIAIDGVDAAPIAAHTYDNQLFLPIADRFLTFGGAAYNNGDAYLREIDPFTVIRTGPYLFDPNKADGNKVGGTTGSHVQREQPTLEIIGGEMWENRDIYQNIPGNSALPYSFVNGTSAYTQENGKDVVYINARPGPGTGAFLYKYIINDVNNPSLDQLSLVGIYWSGIGGQGAGLYDPVLNIYIRSGVSTFTFWDLAKAGSDNRNQPVNFTDLSGQFAVNDNFGMDYDANRHRYLLWEGYSDVWALYPPASVSSDGWQMAKMPISQTQGPSIGPGVGVLGKWKYIAQLDVFMGLQGNIEGNVWLYKPTGWEHPQLGKRAIKPTISPISGDYSGLINVTMQTQQQQGTIYYTLDDSEPTAQSLVYTGPFAVNQPIVIKAMTIAAGLRNSRVTAVNYGIGSPPGETNQVPVINQVVIDTNPITDEQSTTITVFATDSDGPEPLTYQWQQVAGNGQINSVSATTISYTPTDVTSSEQHQLLLEVSDGTDVVSEIVEITVTDANAPPQLYFNDFTQLDLSDWQVTDQGDQQAPSIWQIQQGQLRQLSNIWSLPNDDGSIPDKLGTFISYQLGFDWQNVIIDVDIQSQDDDAVGIMFRQDSAGNYYRFSWDQSRGYRRLVKYYNGNFTVLAEDQVPYITGQTYHLTVRADGNQLVVLVNQQQIFTITDTLNPILQGTLALYSWGNEGGIFDNLQVTELAAGSPKLPIIHQLLVSDNPINDQQQTQLTVDISDPDTPTEQLTTQWQIITGGGQLSNSSGLQTLYTPNDVSGTEQHIIQVSVSDGVNSVSQTAEILITDASAPPLLYFNDFTQLDLSDWQVTDQGDQQAPSIWQIQQGQLRQLSNIWSLPNDDGSIPDKLGTFISYQLGFDWQNVIIDVDIQSQDDDAVGIMFRQDSAGNYYRFSWDQSRGYRRLVKYYNGNFTVLAEDQVPYITGQTYHLTVRADGNQLVVLVNQQQIFTITDTLNPILQGTLALYSWGNEGGIFDNLQVTELAAGSPKLPIIHQLLVSDNPINDQQQTQLTVDISDPDTPTEQLTTQWQIITGGGQLSSSSGLQTLYTPNDVSDTEQHIIQVTVSDGINTVSQQQVITVTDSENQPSTPLLEESFTGLDFANWQVITEGTIQAPAQWEIQQNKLIQYSNVHSTPVEVTDPAKLGTYIQYLPGKEWVDYQVEVKLRSTDDDQVGIMFRVLDSQHYYRFGWNSSGNRRQLVKREGSNFIVLAEDNIGYQPWATYSLKVIAKGSQLSVFINSQLIFEVNDDSYLQGTIALYSWANIGSEFSELLVTDLSTGLKPPQISAEQGLPAIVNENSQVGLSVAVDNDSAPTTQYNWQLIGTGQLSATNTAAINYQVAEVDKVQPVKIVATLTNNNLSTQQIYYGTVIDNELPDRIMDEDFTEFNQAFWQVVTDGNIAAPAHWHISQGMLVEDANVFGPPTDATDITKKGTFLVYQPGKQWVNYQLNCLIRSDDDDAVGVAFRYQDHQHYYRFSWDKQRQYRRLVKRVGDSYTLLAEDSVVYQQGKTYQLKVIANGNNIQVIIDGETIFNVEDSSLNKGTIAPYSWGSNGSRFDNFLVDLLP